MKIYLALLVVLGVQLCCLAECFNKKMNLGGYGEEKFLEDGDKFNLIRFKDDIENKTGKQYTRFREISYAKQTVAGTNYRITVCATDEENRETTLEVVLFQSLKCRRFKLTGAKKLWNGCAKKKPRVYDDDD